LTVVHLPGLNTPQFNWCRTRLPNHPQPFPPIYQPEVAARAIAWASGQRKREVWVAWSTYEAILGQKIAPGFADHYLAKHAVEGQEMENPVSPDRPDNLFETVPGNQYAAHGIFDDRARTWSLMDKIQRHARGILAGVGLAAATYAVLRGCNREGWQQ